ncbi:MAG: glycosyltransferase [Candidatus Roizmanbacteria bacterium]
MNDTSINTDHQRIGVIMVHFDNISNTQKSVKSIIDSPLIHHIIIINNSSSAITNAYLVSQNKTKIINSQNNVGYGKAINLGLDQLKDSNITHILIMNNNILLDQISLNNLLLTIDTDLMIVSPVIYDELGSVWFHGGELDKIRYSAGHKTGKIDFLSGACLLTTKFVLNVIGSFSEDYFLYYEDVDFSLRALQKKVALKIVENSKAIHITKKDSTSNKNMNYYLSRNHLLLIKKFAPISTQFIEYFRIPYTIIEHIMNNEIDSVIGIIDYIRGKKGIRNE